MNTQTEGQDAVSISMTKRARPRLLTGRWLGTCLALGALAPAVATSTVIVSEGSLTITTTLNDNVRVTNGATVEVASGGSVNGTGPDGSAPPGFSAAIQAQPLSGSRIVVSGDGLVQGGVDQLAISQLGTGRIDLRDNARLTSGRDDRVAVLSFGLSEPPDLQLKTNIGGSSYVDGNVHADGVVSVFGNAVINGNLREANGGTNLLMSGGTITGDVGASSLVGHIGYFTGGSVLGSYGGGNTTNFDFSMRGGSIEGSWSTTAQQLHAEFHDGQVGGGLAFQLSGSLMADNRLSIFGGQIDTLAGGWLIDWAQGSYVDGEFIQGDTPIFLDIWGGALGYGESGNGVRLTGLANMDVYGVGLALAGNRLTGTLADGSLIDLLLAYDPNWNGQVRLHDVSVPEPGTLALLAVGLFGIAVASRRRKFAEAVAKA
jgi:hypothetical protein